MSRDEGIVILGAGMTGLAAAWSSGLPVYEAAGGPGGICSSYYVRPGSDVRLADCPSDGDAYRFEVGGGHWIFGGDPVVLRLINTLTTLKRYTRRSSVYFPDEHVFVPYPIQNHLRALQPALAREALQEIVGRSQVSGECATLADWLERSFGPTLCQAFFYPFHDLYTAGLYREIAPQDAYKSPVEVRMAIEGALAEAPAVGYNTTFAYPREGLNHLSVQLASKCEVHYGKRAVSIDARERVIRFADGTARAYTTLVSTLPLNRTVFMSGLAIEAEPDPSTSVLVVNIGATRGPQCPPDHWLYIPKSRSGFHRVGFYSNVDPSFLPERRRERGDAVSLYVEKGYRDGATPTPSELAAVAQGVAAELREWGWIREPEVLDPTWVDVAYTWAWPGSRWRADALRMLDEQDILQVGRYARWVFQGIADSIRDGLFVGGALGS